MAISDEEGEVGQGGAIPMMQNIELGSIPKFDRNGEVTSLGARWKKWKRGFKLFMTAKGVENTTQKHALLLHYGGPEVQDIFDTLPNNGAADDFETAMNKLDNYFTPAVNVPYERHLFRQMTQLETETIDQYVMRLTQRANNCEFGENLKEHVRDQVVDKCRSSVLRRKFLEKGSD